jgi:hypothetical protein
MKSIYVRPFICKFIDEVCYIEFSDIRGITLDLIAVEVGHSDTDHTTCLNVPSIGLVVAGDVAYNDVHPYLAESNESGIRPYNLLRCYTNTIT